MPSRQARSTPSATPQVCTLLYAAGAARVVKFLPAPALPLDAVVKDGVIELRDIHLAPQAVELLHVALERIKPRIINCRVPIKMRLEPHWRPRVAP